MSGFPKLIPAFTALIEIDPPSQVGPTRGGGPLSHVVILPSSTLRSELGYAINLDAGFLHGGDFIKADPDGNHVRLEVQSLARDKISGGLVRFNYTGTITMTGPAGKVLRGEADASTTPFGDCFMTPVFETSVPQLSALQNKIYVGAGRFILEPGKPVTVEYKISEVAV